jgi:hypothetical protein
MTQEQKDFKIGTVKVLLTPRENLTIGSIVSVDGYFYYVKENNHGSLLLAKNQNDTTRSDISYVDSVYTVLVTCNDHMTVGAKYLIDNNTSWSIKKCETFEELSEVQGMPKMLVYSQNIPEFILKNVCNSSIQHGYYVKVLMETKVIETPQHKKLEVRIPAFRSDKTTIIEKYIVGVDKHEINIFETAKAIAKEIYMFPEKVGTGVCFDNKRFEDFFVEHKNNILKYK